jgi:hypothetical protein
MISEWCIKKRNDMKKIYNILVLLFACSFTAAAQADRFQQLVGKWESDDGAGIEVIDSTKIFLTYQGEKKRIVSFKADFSKTPSWFDFVVADSAQRQEVKSLIQFIGPDTMQWQVFESTRSANFDPNSGEILRLHRKK